MEKQKRGIFCIEYGVEEVLSFKPPLALLGKQLDFPIIFRTADARAKLVKDIKEWSDRSDDKYPALWLTGHGMIQSVYVDDRKGAGYNRLDLRSLADILESGPLTGFLVHFSACSTMASSIDDYRHFFKATEVEAVSGYSKDIDWIESLAFEFLYMKQLQKAMKYDVAGKKDGGITQEIVNDLHEALIDSRKCQGLIDALGFRMVTRKELDTL